MTKSVNTPWRSMVQKADPEFDKKKRRELEYEFSKKREFYANPAERGAYADDD